MTRNGKLSKNDMARVVVQALYALPTLPAADHPKVIKRASRGTVATLANQHKMAVAALHSTHFSQH